MHCLSGHFVASRSVQCYTAYSLSEHYCTTKYNFVNIIAQLTIQVNIIVQSTIQVMSTVEEKNNSKQKSAVEKSTIQTKKVYTAEKTYNPKQSIIYSVKKSTMQEWRKRAPQQTL